MYIYWLEFIIAGVLIYFSGKKLSTLANQLSEEKGISKGLVGIFLLGAITSFPEASVTISSVGIFKAPNIALGNVLGSNLFNVSIIGILPFFGLKREKLGRDTKMSLFLFLLLTLISFIAIITKLPYSILNFSLINFLILGFYAFGLFLMYRAATNGPNIQHDDESVEITSTNLLITKIMIYAGAIIASGVLASFAAKNISRAPYLSESFVGALFLAIATSLPEVSVTIHLIKIKSLNMALGNLFGSNCFNLLLIPVADIFYKQNIYLETSNSLVIPIVSSIIIAFIGLLGIKLLKENQVKKFGFDSLVIVVLYLAAIFLINRY